MRSGEPRVERRARRWASRMLAVVSADKRAVLRRVRAFADLDDAECDAVLGVLKAKRGAPGDVLFREGDRGDSLMIVLEGELSVRVKTPGTGGDEEVGRLGPGEVVGEMAFVDAEPRSATVSTPGGATILEFTRAGLAVLRRDAPRVAAAIHRNVLADLARRLRDAGEKMADGGASPESLRRGPESMRRAGHATAAQLRALSQAFQDYAAEDLELLAHVALVRQLARGDVVIREGAAGDACFLLVAGAVQVTRGGSPIATLGPGAIVGQLALLDRAPRSATVTCAEAGIALEVPASAFANLVRASSPIALRFQAQIMLAGVRQLREATRKVAASQSRLAVAGAAPNSLRMIDDWDVGDDDDGAAAPPLELAIVPREGRR
jgi:CRP-like cAMP-binding protein